MLEDECFQIDIRSEIAKKNSNECASVNNAFKEFVDKCTDLADMDRIGKVSDEIRFMNDTIQIQLLHNSDVETKIVCQMYTNRPLELQTELTKKVT